MPSSPGAWLPAPACPRPATWPNAWQSPAHRVLTAYEQLLAEGYVAGHSGAGTFVADGVAPDIVSHDVEDTQRQPACRADFVPHWRGLRPVRRGVDAECKHPVRRGGAVRWTRYRLRRCAAPASSLMQSFDPMNLSYADPSGDLALREEVAKYLRVARAVPLRAGPDPDPVRCAAGDRPVHPLFVEPGGRRSGWKTPATSPRGKRCWPRGRGSSPSPSIVTAWSWRPGGGPSPMPAWPPSRHPTNIRRAPS